MAKSKKNRKKRITKKLLNKYRLVILNEDTFEERISFKLNRLNVFVFAGFMSVIVIIFTTMLIAFTPLREYIPGYSSTALNAKATYLVNVTDSLESVIALNQKYYNRIQQVLKGDIAQSELESDAIINSQNQVTEEEKVSLKPSTEDIKLREEVLREERYSLFEDETSNIDLSLFPPVKGQITTTYNVTEKHFGIDVAVTKDTPVKAAADGVVILSEWTADTGYVIIVEHDHKLLTVYKHNSSLTKKQGEYVKSGEVIATAGTTGVLSTGPHLHFELWHNGFPTDPSQFIDFE